MFDEVTRRALGKETANRTPGLIYTAAAQTETLAADTILVAFHSFGPMIVHQNEEYHCAEGIARVIRQMVRALADLGFGIIVTSYGEDAGRIHGFLQSGAPDLKIMVVDEEVAGSSEIMKSIGRLRRIASIRPFSDNVDHLKRLYRAGDFNSIPRALASTAAVAIFKAVRRVELWINNIKLANDAIECAEYVESVNSDVSIGHVLISHYYTYPELVHLKDKNVVLYLPDYMPHFYKSSPEMGASRQSALIGIKMVAKARRILTNSAFTASYLPETELAARPENIVHVPLPFLNDNSRSAESPGRFGRLPRYYAFYPTRDRPSKRLADFARTVAIVNERLEKAGNEERLVGILTTSLTGKSAAGAEKHLVSLSELTDAELGYLYKNALCLLFTSEMEGNFPTQITEALHLDVPVVATNIPLITLELGDVSASLDLVDVGDCEGFADRVMSILADRAAAVRRQKDAKELSSRKFAYDNFKSGLSELFRR